MNQPATIFDYIKSQETLYNTDQVEIFDNYRWNMKRYIQMVVSMLNSKFLEEDNEYKTKNPYKNIVRPLMNLRYRAESIDVKDIEIYVENREKFHLSFLVKKYYHDIFIKKHNLDAFFDEAQEECIAFGGLLIQKTDTACPEVMPLQSIAFCDQTDILGGPIAFKHNFSPDKLREMADKGWGDKKNGADITIENLISLSRTEKEPFQTHTGKVNNTTGKNIEVYLVFGTLPKSYLTETENGNLDKKEWVRQVQIVAFYQSEEKREKVGVTLYCKLEEESRFKFHMSKKIYGRAIGEGGVEELFDAQIWTNFYLIAKKNMLEAASKVILFTDDPAYVNRNKIQDMENLEITQIEEGKSIQQVPTFAPQRIQIFEKSIEEWWEYSQTVESANDPVLGKEPPSGTPFRLQALVTQEGKGLHEYRRGKFATFIEEVHKDWIIPYIVKEIIKGAEFLSTLSTDEMQWVTNRMAENQAHRMQVEQILNGEIPENIEILKQKAVQEISKIGNKRWIKILEGEFKDTDLSVSVNIVGRQKNLSAMVDKIVNIFRFVFANPAAFQQAMQIPGMSLAFNDILEFSGLNPVDFASFSTPMQLLPQSSPAPTSSSPTPSSQTMQLPATSSLTPSYATQ